MEELIIETPDPESSGDGMDALPEATDPDTEVTMSESEENPDENDGEDAEFIEDSDSDADEDSDSDEDEESDSAPGEETGSSEDTSTHAAYYSDVTDSLLLVETMERQNDILCAGFMSTLFILGIILGVLIIHGFRLRRV